MNLYFIDQVYIGRPISELSKTTRFKSIGPGDIAIFQQDRRLVMVVLNHAVNARANVTDFPMVAQILSDDNKLSDLKPILYYTDSYSKTIAHLNGLKILSVLFRNHPLASRLFLETINLIYHRISQRDASLMLALLSVNQSIPGFKSHNNKFSGDKAVIKGPSNSKLDTDNLTIANSEISGRADNQEDKDENINAGKLYIVEKLFSPRMKKEFYESLALGYTEKETLLKIRTAHTQAFLSIFQKLQKEKRDLYSRL